MFGSSSSTSNLFGSSENSSGSILPVFQEEPVCAKCCPKLTYEQRYGYIYTFFVHCFTESFGRIYGYVICSGIGFVLSLIGTLVLFGGFSAANLALFAVLYVLGNLICKRITLEMYLH